MADRDRTHGDEPRDAAPDREQQPERVSQLTVAASLAFGLSGVLTAILLIVAARSARTTGDAGGLTLFGMLLGASLVSVLGPAIWYGRQGRWRRLAVIGGNIAAVVFFIGSFFVFA